MRSSNKKCLLRAVVIFFTFLTNDYSYTQVSKEKKILKPSSVDQYTYYEYWNPYRRKVDKKNNRDFFLSAPYFEVTRNSQGKIKTVVKYNLKNEKVDSWHIKWNRSGTRSEYIVKFHQKGYITRLDSLLFSHKLSEVKPGWHAKVKSKKDGRPLRYDIYDNNGIRLYFYRFHYTQRSDSIIAMETIQSSYFRSDSTLVGRHILFMENGEWLREIHFKDSKSELESVTRFEVSLLREETIITRLDKDGKEIASRIIQLSYPDEYSYRFDWRPDTVLIVENIEIKKDTVVKFISPVLASVWYGFPLVSGAALNVNSPMKPTYGFFFSPRGNMIIRGQKYSLGMEVVSYDIPIKDSTESINGIGAFAAAQYDLNKNFDWIPQNVEAALRIGGGMLSSGFGISFSGSFGYHFIPTRIYLGLYSQAIIAYDELGTGSVTGWGSLGISLGANVGDINPDLLKPYKDKLDEGAIFTYIFKEIITKSNLVFSSDYPIGVGTYISEYFLEPKSFNTIKVRTPFSVNIAKMKVQFLLSYLNYSLQPKDNSELLFGSHAYFFGTDFNLNELLSFWGNNFEKNFEFNVGYFHSGFGISSGIGLGYNFKTIPINLNTYAKFYGLPIEEIFTGWFSFGFGLGIELHKFFLNSESKDDN